MSAGLKLLRSIIDEGARSSVSELSEILFQGDAELNAYRYFNEHYRRHGQIPSVPTMQQNGFRLPERQEPISYYMERCRNRARYNSLTALQGRLPALIRNNDIEEALALLRETTSLSNMVDVASAVISASNAFDRVMEQYRVDQGREGLRGITLGYDCIDRVTEGAQGGDIFILAARPNMGKSYLLLKAALAAHRSGRSVLFASMEMTIDQLARRMLGMESGVNPDYIRRGEVSSWGEELLVETMDVFGNGAPFQFVSGNLRKSVGQIDALIQEYSPDIIYIDAGYLLHSEKGRSKDRREKISDVAEELKAVALDRNRPIFITVQLNRAGVVKKGANGKSANEPGTDNLAESDVLGQIATSVILAYPPTDTMRDKRILSMVKNRDGPLIKFLINWGFEPLDFSFIKEVDDSFNPEEDSLESEDLNDSWSD